MRRGMFAMTAFLLASLTLINLFSLHTGILENHLNTTSKILDGEETFYRARNFESSFIFAVLSGKTDTWYDYWKPTYGYFSGMQCKQVNMSFQDFLNEILHDRGDYITIDPYLGAQTCVVKEIDYKGFKTMGIIRSTLWIDKHSPLSSFYQ